jgi:hypothetical protein
LGLQNRSAVDGSSVKRYVNIPVVAISPTTTQKNESKGGLYTLRYNPSQIIKGVVSNTGRLTFSQIQRKYSNRIEGHFGLM